MKCLLHIFVLLFIVSCSTTKDQSIREPSSIDFNCVSLIKKLRNNPKPPPEEFTRIKSKYSELFEIKNLSYDEYLNYSKLLKSNEQTISSPSKSEHILAILDHVDSKYSKEMSGYINNPIEIKNQLRIYKKAKSIKINQYTTSQDFIDFSQEIMLLSKGIKINSLKNFSRSDQIDKILSHSLIYHGLESLMIRFPEKERFHHLSLMKKFINRFFTERNNNVFANGFLIYSGIYIPSLIKTNLQIIPQDLMNKIILEGIEKHKNELDYYLKRSKIKYEYNRIVDIYKPISFFIGAYYIYDILSEQGVTLENFDEKFKEFSKDLPKLLIESMLKKISKNDTIDYINADYEQKLNILVEEAVKLHEDENGTTLSDAEKAELKELFRAQISPN